MVSHRIRQSDTIYQRLFNGVDITHFDVYSPAQERLGSVLDVLFDQDNRLCYLNIDSSSRPGNPSQLLPLNRFRIDEARRRIYVELTNRTVGQSAVSPNVQPAVSTTPVISDRVPPVRVLEDTTPLEVDGPIEFSAPLETEVPLEAPVVIVPGGVSISQTAAAQHVPTVQSEQEIPVVRAMPEVPEVRANAATIATNIRTEDEESIKLLEERLVVNRQRRKVGEVILRKEIVTEMVQIPVRREVLVVEQAGTVNRRLASFYLDGQEQQGEPVNSNAVMRQSSQAFLNRGGKSTVNAEFSSIEEAIQFLQHFSSQFGNAEVQMLLRRN